MTSKGPKEIYDEQPFKVRSKLCQNGQTPTLSKLSGSEDRSEAVVRRDVRRESQVLQQDTAHLVRPSLGRDKEQAQPGEVSPALVPGQGEVVDVLTSGPHLFLLEHFTPTSAPSLVTRTSTSSGSLWRQATVSWVMFL